MYHAETWREKITLFVTILGPILVTQISFYAMNLVDTMMSGQAGTNDLAGVAIGSSLWMPVFTGLGGILLAVTPIVAQLMGSGQREKIAESVTQALYLAILLAGIVLLMGTLLLDPVLAVMDLEQTVQYIAKHYLIGLSFGIVPLFAMHVLRYFFDAQGFTQITMFIVLLALPVNIFLNYGLIFGNFGFPELGGIGAGYATAATYWLFFVISVGMTFRIKAMRGYRLFVRWFVPSLKAWKEQLVIGVPIGLSIFFESSIFSAVTILVAVMFDTITIAAHQAALNFTSLLFMVPLSISMALTIVVGYAVGGKRIQHARQYTCLGVFLAIGVLSFFSVFLYIFREQIAYLYTTDPEVVAMAKQFLIFAIFYQLSDAAQSSLQGVLRGYKDVTVPFITAFISYWGLGLPIGYMLASWTALGPYGYWIGITIGLSCAAIGFLIRLQVVQKRTKGLNTV